MYLRKCSLNLAILVALATTALSPRSPFSQTPNIIPDGARAVAEAYRDEWGQRAKVNPEFYEVIGKEIDLRYLTVQDGYIYSTLYEPDARRFAESVAIDPTMFATATMYVFPMLLKGEHVASVMVIANKDEAGNAVSPDAGDYVFLGLRFPSDPLDQILEATTGGYGYSERIPFSVVAFMGGIGGVFVQLHGSGNDQLVPVNKGAVAALSLNTSKDGAVVVLDKREAARRIKRRILQERFSE